MLFRSEASSGMKTASSQWFDKRLMHRQAQTELETEGTVEATSAREEKEMQALLEMFAMGVGAVDEFQAKLQEELSALEVHRP